MKGAAEVGADVAMVARRSVASLIEAAKKVGGNVETVTKVAVTGAIYAAFDNQQHVGQGSQCKCWSV
ncbi:MAG TPA: hypothetical protein VLX29_10735 [Nitrospirota bacterium]|nr:hypothetical protein [Nitrospirota bacterium]